eukprot:m.371752 g.371752  ORF g.371752 m.371752 type:complete len:69 (-) comp59681_c0_seq1:35-241(-)
MVKSTRTKSNSTCRDGICSETCESCVFSMYTKCNLLQYSILTMNAMSVSSYADLPAMVRNNDMQLTDT